MTTNSKGITRNENIAVHYIFVNSHLQKSHIVVLYLCMLAHGFIQSTVSMPGL